MIADLPLALRLEGAAARLSARIAEHARALHPEAFARPIAGGVASYCGPSSPINKLIGLGLREPIDEAQLDAIERAFFASGSPVQAEVCALMPASNLALFGRRGYTLQGFEDVLGLDLAHEPPAPPAAVAIEAVTPATLSPWIQTVSDAFAQPDGSGAGPRPDEPAHDALNAIMRLFIQGSGARAYLARVDGQIAGGASLRTDEGIAQLTGAATLAAFRRRGVQTALLRARLRQARGERCDLATITTQPGSASQANARRQGFALLYTRGLLVKPPPA